MPNYLPPDFNLTSDVWLCDLTVRPADGPPDIAGLDCQKYLPSRGMWDLTPPWSAGFYLAWSPPVHIRFPRASPFLGSWPTWKVCCVECPSGSQQYYRAYWADVQHEGFPNEYIEWVGVQCDADLLAVPPPGGSEPTGVGPDAGGVVPPAAPPATVLPPGPFPPVVVPPGESFLDSFSGTPSTDLATHVSDTGNSWIAGSGTINLNSIGVGVEGVDTGGAWQTYIATYGGSPTTPLTMQFTTPSDVSYGFFQGIVMRVLDANNYHFWVIQSINGIDWQLAYYEVVGGSVNNLFTGSNFSMTCSVTYHLLIEFAGALMTATLNDPGSVVATESYSDTTDAAATPIGLFSWVNSTYPNPCLVQRLSR